MSVVGSLPMHRFRNPWFPHLLMLGTWTTSYSRLGAAVTFNASVLLDINDKIKISRPVSIDLLWAFGPGNKIVFYVAAYAAIWLTCC